MKCWNSQQTSGWMYPTVVICTYGFFSMMRPGEPFLTPFLTGPYKNISISQVSREVYPIWTYSNLVLLVPVFLVTDLLRYKPVVVLQGLCSVVAWLLLLFGSGVRAVQIALFVYSIASASDVGYYAYIYSIVHAEHYQRVTSYCRGSILVGFAVGSLLGQLLTSFGATSFYWLNVITLLFLSIALLLSFLLPMPQRSLLLNDLHPNGPNLDISSDLARPSRFSVFTLRRVRWRYILCSWSKLVKDCKECYSSVTILFLSLWWSMGRCGFYQVSNYVQILWSLKEPHDNFTAYNGAVDAVATLSGAATSFAVGHMTLSWSMWGELVLGVFSVVTAGSVYVMDITRNIWICYASYVLFKSSYMMMITICTFQIAKKLSKECYALMFGVNTFLATAIQTILTAVVINTKSLQLPLTTQYFIYSTFFAIIAFIFLIRGVYSVYHVRRSLLEERSPGGHVCDRSTDPPKNTQF
ncbi:thiamine transporter 2-like [Scleropages formosus]|uniref:thiamine transporter 2-like n=1 Tax=Scleropages formosus TaxID=113540 RepID=UPI0010FAB0BB|nr:thiamine transporter 2-like [Scleropages formosus]